VSAAFSCDWNRRSGCARGVTIWEELKKCYKLCDTEYARKTSIKMRPIILSIAIFLFASSGYGNIETLNLKRDSGKCIAAWNASDWGGVIASFPDRFVQGSGGRDALVKTIHENLFIPDSKELLRVEVKSGVPEDPIRAGKWLLSLLPISGTLITPNGSEIVQSTFLLGISDNGGTDWRFLPLYGISQKTVDKLFPEFTAFCRVPKATPAVIRLKRT
jgi:hypothetical protein